MIRGRVLVQLRDEVLDPQGTTVAQALENLGYDDVVSVRQGKVFEVELDTDDPAAAEARLEEMAEKLLANPVIERFRVSVGRAGEADEAAGGVPGGAPGTGGGVEAPPAGGRDAPGGVESAGGEVESAGDGAGEAGDAGAGTQRPAGAPAPMAPDHGGRRDGLARRTGRDRRGAERRSGIDRRSFGRDRSDEPPADDRRSDDERRQGKDRRDDSDRRSGEDRREVPTGAARNGPSRSRSAARPGECRVVGARAMATVRGKARAPTRGRVELIGIEATIFPEEGAS